MAGKQKSRRTDWREQRRLQAWALFQKGWKQSKIAEAFGVTKQAVSVWIKRARSEGEDGLLSHPPPGAKPKLPRKVLQQLPELLLRGTESFGFRGNLWTTKRIAAVIEKTWGVRYHPDHVSRLMKNLGWSPQKPKKKGHPAKRGSDRRVADAEVAGDRGAGSC